MSLDLGVSMAKTVDKTVSINKLDTRSPRTPLTRSSPHLSHFSSTPLIETKQYETGLLVE
jgi:hypothetical protein